MKGKCIFINQLQYRYFKGQARSTKSSVREKQPINQNHHQLQILTKNDVISVDDICDLMEGAKRLTITC